MARAQVAQHSPRAEVDRVKLVPEDALLPKLLFREDSPCDHLEDEQDSDHLGQEADDEGERTEELEEREEDCEDGRSKPVGPLNPADRALQVFDFHPSMRPITPATSRYAGIAKDRSPQHAAVCDRRSLHVGVPGGRRSRRTGYKALSSSSAMSNRRMSSRFFVFAASSSMTRQ